MKNVFVVIENEHGEIFIKVTSTKELAIKYVKEETDGICTIEEHEIDGNWIDTIEIV